MNKPEPLTAPRSCAFCNWNGDVGAFAHATVVHPDKDWAVVPQMGHEFVIDMTLVASAARTPSQPDRPVDSYPFAEVCPGCGRSDEHAAPCTVRVRLPGHATPSQPDLRAGRTSRE